MYSFGPIPKLKKSGRLVGTHQQIDRVARRSLALLIGGSNNFPTIQQILHFEGIRGPDGVKLRSPGVDEPHHFINPSAPHEGDLLHLIHSHIENLAAALRDDNQERAAFEAAWLAHAVTDGLTPAHQVPYQEMIEELRGNRKLKHQTVKDKIIIKGNTPKDTIKNSWYYWGPKGILTSHTLFEGGVASVVRGRRMRVIRLNADRLLAPHASSYESYYIKSVKAVAALDMYNSFKRAGWTEALARQTIESLIPIIVEAVVQAWYVAYSMASRDRNAH